MPRAARRHGLLSSLRLLGAAAFLLWGACDIGAPSGEGQGCLRIHQGEYSFPVKRIVKGGVVARVSQPGLDLVTGRIKQLVQGFFDVDEDGRAIVPLASLGLGAIGTEVGPFDAELRDLVLSVDLSALSVQLVPGSSPPRLTVTVTDAAVGIEAGEVAGGFEILFIGGDAACGLADGPTGYVALVSFTLEITLATDEDASLDVSVGVEAVDVADVSLSVVTDCGIVECTDGCGECQLLCGAADLAAQLAGFVQGVFDGLVDTLATFLADQLADLVLDEVLNGRPLAVEGELDVAGIGRLLLPYLATARPLGVLARPAGDAFASDGTGAGAGLDVLLDAGLDASPAHPCAGDIGLEPVFEAGAAPPFPQLLANGEPYHLGIAVSGAVVNESVWALFKAGVLCVDADTDTLAELLGADATIRAATLDIMMPGLSSLAGRDAPVRVRLRPALDDLPVVRFDHPVTGAPIGLDLLDAVMALDVMVGDHFLQVLAVQADLGLGLAVDALPGARLGLRLEDLAVDDVRVIDDDVVSGAQLDLVIPFVVDLLMGILADQPISLDVDPTPLVEELLGLPLVPVVSAIEPAGDWLRILVSLEEAEPEPASDGVEPISMRRPAGAGEVEVELPALPGHEVQLRVAGGGWSAWVEPGALQRITHPRLWLADEVEVQARMRPAGGVPGLPFSLGTLPPPEVTPSPAGRGAVRDRDGGGAALPRPTPGASAGCASHGPGGSLGLTLLVCGCWLLLRRRGRSCTTMVCGAAALAIFVLPSCADQVVAPAWECVGHDQCPEGYLCGPEGSCTVASTCDADLDCCPGAECTGGGWCRPTTECDPVRTCAGLDVTCEAGRCVPAPCGQSLADCAGDAVCVAGRCLDDAPCGGACGAGLACHVASGRCLPADGCPQSCAPHEVAVVSSDAAPDPFTCNGPFPCECAELPPVEPGLPGEDLVVLATPGAPSTVSYDPVYGDLVLSRFPASPSPREDVVLDGLPPAGAGATAPGSYRDGLTEPGPDRGMRPAAVLAPAGSAPQLHVLYQDRDDGGLRALHADPLTGAVAASYSLGLPGAVGRYSCLVEDPVSGRLVGWTFIEANEAGTHSQLVRLEADVHPPAGAGSWHAQMVAETALPLRDVAPCDGACGAAEICARTAVGSDICVPVLDAAAACDPPCTGAHDICGPPGSAETVGGACAQRILTDHSADRLPSGEGLYVACAPAGQDIVVAWYDADRRGLAVTRGPGGVGTVQWVAGGPAGEEGDRGRHVAPTSDPDGDVTVFFQDTTRGSLWAARQTGAQGAWESEVVHEGTTQDLGAWSAAAAGPGGAPIVAYGDATSANIWVAAWSPDGCWHRSAVLSAGAWTTPSVAPAAGGRLFVGARRLSLGTFGPAHGLAVLDVPTPSGACGDR